MATNHPKSGPNNAPQFQMAGVPYVTSSVANEVKGVHNSAGSPAPIQVDFGYVTKWVEIKNTHASNKLRVALTMSGAFNNGERLPENIVKAADKTRNFLIVDKGETVKYDIRCKSLFFVSDVVHGSPSATGQSSQFELRAGLTLIQATEFPILSGSTGFDGVG